MRVVITGANRGIGQALDEKLSNLGHHVIGTARQGGEFEHLDVSKPSSHAALARKLDTQPIDLLVCNAGVYSDKHQNLADGYPHEMWRDTFEVNVTGVFLTIQNLLPNLQMSTSPKIAIISSQMASDKLASGKSYIYRASKAAVLNLGRNLAADLHGIGIAVGIYHPGWARSEIGGSNADISAAEAAAGLADRFESLSLETTGCFETWDGRQHPF